MRWTVLSDNRSDGGALETEHGLSILLETSGHKLLLDTGRSDMFMRNAEALGIRLDDVDYVFISHGHYDHAGGLKAFMEFNKKAKVIVSPHAMNGNYFSLRGHLHSLAAEWPSFSEERLIAVEHTRDIDGWIHVIADIDHSHPMPDANRHLFVQGISGGMVPDDFCHEIALYADGLLFTGCAHNGLENILDACPWPVQSVVGGFHLIDRHETTEELKSLAKRLKRDYPTTGFYTSHCTGDSAFETMREVMGEQIKRFYCGLIES